ncbi:MAG: ParB/RepB/Spo0J family partition protein [Firmicutes bacterium]|jgi:ParB family chromosome partitioning protein|nr:ParB/RepB/Spo0J family partition protein [Bacillota bacterium]
MSRKALGRGLKALIPQVEEGDGRVQELPINTICPNPNQPRRNFDEDALQELADSIREHGVLEPLIVRPVGGSYEIVVGERRWRACQIAGVTTVPVLIRDLSDRDAMELALVENLQREDLNPIEEAEAYRRLLDEFGLTQEEVARRVGKERSTVANRLRLLGLRGRSREALEKGEISAGHAKVLLSITSDAHRDAVVRRIVDEGLSVRQTEQLVRRLQQQAKRPVPREERKPDLDVHWAAIEDELRRVLGTKVNVVHKGSKGRIEIEFYTEEDVERILNVLRGHE